MSTRASQTLRIFLSSPGDVAEERQAVKEVVRQVEADPLYREWLHLEVIAWDDLKWRIPMVPYMTPQKAINAGIPRPAICDLVIVIFWSRFGTPLPDDERRPDNGERYQSGTEAEYLDALWAHEKSTTDPKRPQIVIYRCTRPVVIDRRDPKRMEKLDQGDKVDAFFESFKALDGSLKGMANDFSDLADFRTKLAADIRFFRDGLTRAGPGTKPAADWVPGVKVGSDERYTLVKPLGEGGNGLVWLAERALPDGSTSQVAIKALKAEVSEDAERARRFLDELSIMARHGRADKHIVEIYDFGRHGQHLYSVMPLMEGGTLRDQIQGKIFTLEDALGWLEQVGKALDYIQKTAPNMVHRDVKPENMLLSEDRETLYLSDFGLAISPTGTRHTDGGKPAGTGRYMAPEQWKHEPLSAQTDLYALGILAYELLTGHLPYDPTKGDYLLSKAHCEQELPADRHLPDEVLRILRRACAKNPASRYPNARTFLGELRNWEIDPANLDPKIADYLDYLTGEIRDRVLNRFVDLAGDQTTQRKPPPARRYRRFSADDEIFGEHAVSVEADHIAAQEGAPKFVENVRGQLQTMQRTVLIGEPGSGKSWMMQRLALDYSNEWNANREAGNARGMVPVLVLLNEYKSGTFHDFVSAALDTLAPYHDELRSQGRLILLCDALNEMPRDKGQLGELIAYLKDSSAFVVSCRVRDYDDDLKDLKPLEQVRLRELELPAIRELMHKQFKDDTGEELWQAIGGSDELLEFWEKEKAEPNRFWDARERVFFSDESSRRFATVWNEMHRKGARLIPLSRNPYMARLLTDVYRASRQDCHALPSSRAGLFGTFVDLMLRREAKTAERRSQSFPEPGAIRSALTALAYALQQGKTTLLSLKEAEQSAGEAGAAILKAAVDASILTQVTGEDGASLKFTHQLLQEYFACQILLEAMEKDEKNGTNTADQFFRDNGGQGWWDAGVWRETTVILGEFLGERAVGPNRAARWLAPASPEVALDVILRNGEGLTVADVEPETRSALIAGANRWKTVANAPDPRGRASAWRVLGLLEADDRPGVLHFNFKIGEYWLPVPKGTYTLGSDEKDDNNEKHTFTLDYDLHIAKFQITYKQFQAFIDDGENGYRNAKWWDGLHQEAKDQQKQGPQEQYFKYWNHPRENVSWYEAMAFCKWLSAKLGAEIRLPKEDEWEAAARGTDERRYTYGPEFDGKKGNTQVTGIRQTSAVGIFPDGASPCGALDMNGNVWEWMLDEYQPRINANLASDALRSLRGGSWFFNSDYARAASRLYDGPDFRYSVLGLGFRVVLVGTPPSL